MLIKAIPAWVAETNAYVVADEPGGRAILVDAPPDPKRIGDYLADIDVSLVGIVLTHGHIDHTGGAGYLAGTTGAVTYVHPDDDFLTKHPARQLEAMFGMTPPGEYDLPDTFRDLADGQELEVGGFSFEVRQTPGHTPGHCCLLLKSEGILFSGDQLFAGSVGRTDLPGGSWQELMDSMREKVMVLDDTVRVLPGHGPETSIGHERLTNPFRQDWAG